MANFFAQLLDSALALPGRFEAVAANDPVAAVLLAVGGLLTLATVAAFGYLSLRGVIAGLVPTTSGRVVHRP